jgi:hypothetical protein
MGQPNTGPYLSTAPFNNKAQPELRFVGIAGLFAELI